MLRTSQSRIFKLIQILDSMASLEDWGPEAKVVASKKGGGRWSQSNHASRKPGVFPRLQDFQQTTRLSTDYKTFNRL